jgi:uncharacterized protein YlxP (DUF503 family)
MVIGVLQFELLIHGSDSLKEKRRVVRSVKDRLHRDHMVSVAEVALQDRLNVASMGLACVGTDGRRVGDVLDHVCEKLRALGDAEVGRISRSMVAGADLPETAENPADDEALARELLGRFNDNPPQEDPS